MTPDDEPRPRIVPPATRAHRAFDLLSLVAAVASVAAGAWTLDRLPARIPIHFGLGGQPDGWGGRASFVVAFLLPALLHVGLTLLARHPRVFNYPVPITPENAEAQYRLARTFLTILKAILVWTTGLRMWHTGLVARGQAAGLGGWLLPASFVLVLVLVLGYLVVANARSGERASR